MKNIPDNISETAPSDTLEASSPFTELLSTSITRKSSHTAGILLGTVIHIDERAIQIQSFEGEIFSAIAACPLSIDDTSRQCAFMLNDTLDIKAVIIGFLQHSVTIADRATITTNIQQETEILCPEGLRITCGESSLTLNPDGKVEIRGTRIINQASELHRIKAGSVRIN